MATVVVSSNITLMSVCSFVLRDEYVLALCNPVIAFIYAETYMNNLPL